VIGVVKITYMGVNIKWTSMIEENDPGLGAVQTWAAEMIDWLLEIKTPVEAAPPEQQSLLKTQLTDFETRYDAILEAGLQTCPVLEPTEPPPKKRGKSKQNLVQNLLDHLKVRRAETLAFRHHCKVPFDNSQLEHDLRMVKLKQKISGCFRSERGAEVFCIIRSYVSTARKNEQGVLDVIQMDMAGSPFIPAVLQAQLNSPA
jgi:transposase